MSPAPAAAEGAAFGLAVGAGTGPELAVVFRTALARLARGYGIEPRLHESPRRYHTYHSALAAAPGAAPDAVAAIAREDAAHYAAWCRGLAAAGVRALFRTAVNAQSLYLAREALQAVKLERLRGGALDLLLLRDQVQGFYAGDNLYDPVHQRLVRSAGFGREQTAAILGFALEQARALWGAEPERVVLVYKFHLLDGLLSAWARDWSAQLGLRLELLQPDTMNRELLRGAFRGRVLCIGANEWADIMHVVLLRELGLGPQENRCTRNVCLAPGLERLVEYQTVHGSADDIAGSGRVNPGATLRAAAAMLEEHAGCAGAAARMGEALQRLERRGLVTPDLGGRAATAEVAQAALAEFEDGGAATPPAPPRRALVVMDFQNDFAAQLAPEAAAALAQRLEAAAARARAQAVEVLFVRFAGDPELQGPSWRERDRRLGKPPKCLAGTPGADFHRVQPQPGEAVFTKPAAFDAFLAPGFEEHLRRRGIAELVFAGLYCDVCIDATARSAFQRGWSVAVLGDGCASLHHPHAAALEFMRRVYGAAVLDCAAFAPAGP